LLRFLGRRGLAASEVLAASEPAGVAWEAGPASSVAARVYSSTSSCTLFVKDSGDSNGDIADSGEGARRGTDSVLIPGSGLICLWLRTTDDDMKLILPLLLSKLLNEISSIRQRIELGDPFWLPGLT
jgi:hypothetical protein